MGFIVIVIVHALLGGHTPKHNKEMIFYNFVGKKIYNVPLNYSDIKELDLQILGCFLFTVLF